MADSDDLATYYARRAQEFELVYARPERQADLAELRARLCTLLSGERVLEVACGTGYWTQAIADVATHVTATDIGDEVLRLARAKGLDPQRVSIRQADAYMLDGVPGAFTAALAAFWVSHVPRQMLHAFLGGLHRRLPPGGRVVLCDNTFVDGASTPLARTDGGGNGYQKRTLSDGSTYDVMKNYLTEADLHAAAGDVADWSYQVFGPFWVAGYRLAG